ncbi:MAG: hypothetical protein GEU80_07610 [Dehalococcoidia bacterium]|nr:hypothetical protein [Dehalococcoidia bacterium]
MSTHPLDPIFHPRAVALVGVPSSDNDMSRGFLTALLEQGYEQEHGLYPVNPKMTEVRGLRCYPTLLDTPDPVDHVISLVPARVAPELVEQCVQKGVRSIHFFTAGLAETGDPELIEVERRMIERLRDAGIRAIGPNCMGLYVPRSGLAFMGGFPTEPGNVMLISQSGANAGDIIHGLGRRGVRFSKAVSFGNGADVRAHDLFDYAASDPDTEIVTAYIEGAQDGRKMFEAVKRCAAVKPTIILKGGLTAAGARAANSHTGSLAGSVQIFEAMCRQAGAYRAETMDDLHDLVIGVATGARHIRGRGVALVGGGGGFAVLSADAIATAGLEVPPLPEASKARLREFIPLAGTSVNNPIDTNAGGPEGMLRTLGIVAEAAPIDVVITNPMLPRQPGAPGPGGPPPAAADELPPEEHDERMQRAADRASGQLAELQTETGVPFVALLRGREVEGDAADRFQQAATAAGIACYPTVHRAARTLAQLMVWRARREGLPALF